MLPYELVTSSNLSSLSRNFLKIKLRERERERTGILKYQTFLTLFILRPFPSECCSIHFSPSIPFLLSMLSTYLHACALSQCCSTRFSPESPLLRMYVCMYVHICAYVYINIYIYIYTHIYVYTLTHTYIHTHIHTHT